MGQQTESQGAAPKGAGGGHTPGPWRVNTSNRGSSVVADTEYSVKVVARTPPPSMSRTHVADACLMAAAPDLLKELQRARRLLVAEGYIPAATMDAALAKAGGSL